MTMTNMHEFEFEGEGELHELGELEAELGGAHELSHELSHEYEYESEAEAEAEAFFGSLASLAKKALQSPALRRIAMSAARSAMQSLTQGGSESELELEGEFELEGAGELSPIRKVYPDAMLEHMAHEAAEAESEQEAAEAFAPLVPVMASKLIPVVARGARAVAGRPAARAGGHAVAIAPRLMANVMRVAPQLTRGVSQVTRTLYRNPQTRPLLRVIPAIARQTTASLARQVARGRPITPAFAVRTLARQTANMLRSPQKVVRAYRHARALDKRHHRIHRSGPGRVTYPGYGYPGYAPRYWNGSGYANGPGYAPGMVPAPGYGRPPIGATGRPRHDLHPGYVCYPKVRSNGSCGSCGR